MFKSIVQTVAAGALTATLCAGVLSSCSGPASPFDGESIKKLPEFVGLNFPAEAPVLRSDSIDLYVDYSTCVAQAVTSPFYQSVQPAIIDAAPTFYSIKGNTITKETDDKQHIFALLRTIKEVNNADLKTAVQNIVNGDRQAILLTDAEYFMKGVTGDNLNNPYMADYFRSWMSKGNDLYIYCEPYIESGIYSKYRYYMIFTDDRIADNFHDRFRKSLGSAVSGYKMYHLSNKPYETLAFDSSYPIVDQNLSLNTDSRMTPAKDGIDMQEYMTDWKNINKYLLAEAVNAMGNPVPGGLPLLRGIYLKATPSDAYKVTGVDVKVYQLTPAYMQYLDSVQADGRLLPAEAFEEVRDLLTINKKVFEESGEIMLQLDEKMDGTTLLADGNPNLLKVDFVVTDAEENLSGNDDMAGMFKWQSIQSVNEGRFNTSFYESIRQALINDGVNPRNRKNNVIYTIYLNTCNL